MFNPPTVIFTKDVKAHKGKLKFIDCNSLTHDIKAVDTVHNQRNHTLRE
jgi:hypothetical protein